MFETYRAAADEPDDFDYVDEHVDMQSEVGEYGHDEDEEEAGAPETKHHKEPEPAASHVSGEESKHETPGEQTPPQKKPMKKAASKSASSKSSGGGAKKAAAKAPP